MKRILFFLTVSATVLLASCDRDMYKNVEKFAAEEKVYPGGYDFANGLIGMERVEIDLLEAGRIPSGKVNLGKAKLTVVEYDGEEYPFDSLCSWVNVTGLTQAKLYRFKIYTVDEYHNKSVPQEVALVPFTGSDLEKLVVASPKVIASPWAATFVWPNISSVLLDYYGLTFSYTDKDGNTVRGERGENPQFSVENLEAGTSSTIRIQYKIVPRVNDEPILDTVVIERSVLLNMPTSETYQRDLINRNIRGMYPTAQGLKIQWMPVDDFTLQYSTVKYTDGSGTEQSVRVENGDEVSTIPGLKIGTPFSVTSNYKPEGVTGVFIDATPKVYNPDFADLERTEWTSTQSHARPSDSPSPIAHLDGNFSSFLSLCKPGKSTGGASTPAGDRVFFVVDMNEPQEFNYFRIRHRNDGAGLRLWALSIYGSDDGVNFSEIQSNIAVPDVKNGAILETPNMDIPYSYFRYIKVFYEEWDPVNNSAIQISEFYLGVKK
jgi:hypothetical protein